MSVHERINLKSNLGLGERKLERYKLKTGLKLNRLWKGVGAMIILNTANRNAPVKNMDFEVDYSKSTKLNLPQLP